ncbi:hypothetical protein M1146_07310 [Patescibacteria group bacterium]|nr:hypothetical protein [Patescibacteria group bacterium]
MRKIKFLIVLLFITTSLFAQGLGKDDYFQKLLFNPLSNTTVAPRYQFNILPFGNQLGNLGASGTRWNFGYLDTTITNHLSNTTWTLNSVGITTTGTQLNYLAGYTATSGYVPYFNGVSLVNSGFYSDGTNYSFGTTNPTYKLQVVGISGVHNFGTVVPTGYVGNIFQAGIIGITNGFTISNDASNNLTYSMTTSDQVQGFYQNASGSVSIGMLTPTAVLHLKAGTAAPNTAPQKFTSGTL